MPKFDAANVVEALDWDFSKFEGGKGTTPEPTEKLLAEFLRDTANLTVDIAKGREDLELPDEATPEQLFDAVRQLKTSDILEDLFHRMSEMIAKLCQDCPNADQINKLPMRHRAAFFSYMTENVRPEVFGAVTTTNQATRS